MATIIELPSDEPCDLSSQEDIAGAVEKSLEVLRKAKTDTEVFAALLLVTKLVQAERTDAASRRNIFDAVGFTFLNRLLKTDAVPEGCDSTLYQSLAVTLLSCFSTDPELVISPQMLSKIPILCDIIQNAGNEEENLNKKSTIEDTYHILIGMANQIEGLKQLVEHGIVQILCDICSNFYLGYEKAFDLLEILLHYSGEEIWQTNNDCLNQLVTNMASEFKHNQDKRKFVLCKHLAVCLASSSEWVSPREQATWPWDIHQGLSDILRSKSGPDQREPALKLASLMINELGVLWSLGDSGEDKIFFLLLINLACVEVRMGLEDSTKSPTNVGILPSCYSILESCIEFMTCGPTLSLNQKQILQLHNAMTGAFGAVLFYLKENQFEPEKVDDPMVRATVRVLSVWLAEETSALKEQVYEVLPFVLTVAEKSFEDITKPSTGNSSTDQNMTCVSSFPLSKPSAADADLIRLLLPALCHLTAEKEPRDILRVHGTMEMCGTYFSYQWKQFEEGKGEQPETALITLCNIYLNVSLEDPDAIRGPEVYIELYGLIANVLPTLAKQPENLVLAFNMAVLGLTLLKNLSAVPSVRELNQNRRFASAVVEMLARSHQCGKAGECELTSLYRQHWEDITELWLLGMQLLIECVPIFPWLPTTYLQCDWINRTVDLLHKVKGGSVDQGTMSMYNTLLCVLGKHSSSIHAQLIQLNGLKLARKHNMVDLAVVLQTPPTMDST